MDNVETKPKLPKVPEKALEALKEGIQSVLDSKDWAGFLSAIRQIHDYSFNNRLLIMLGQTKRGWPFSPLVAGKTKWQTKFNRNIKKDEFVKPIWIIAPVLINKSDENGNPIVKADGTTEKIPIRFRGVRVYDHHQTEGEEIPTPDTSAMMNQLDCEVSDQVLDGMISVARRRQVQVLQDVPEVEMGAALGRGSGPRHRPWPKPH